MSLRDAQFKTLFSASYEEYVIDKINIKLKAFSEGLDKELDRLEKEIEDERNE